jgi:NADH:ubiquinone oxidoreductase subunit 4 (subunit M)
MYWQPSTNNNPITVSVLSRTIMVLLMIATIVFGVYPQPLLNAMKSPRANVAVESTR